MDDFELVNKVVEAKATKQSFMKASETAGEILTRRLTTASQFRRFRGHKKSDFEASTRILVHVLNRIYFDTQYLDTM